MRNNIYIILIIFLVVSLTSCNSKQEKISILETDNLEIQMIDAYKEAYKELEKGDVIYAAKNLMKQNYCIHSQSGHQSQFCWQLTLFTHKTIMMRLYLS